LAEQGHSFSADRRTRNPETLCVLRAYNAAKCYCGRGSALDPAGGAYSTASGSLAGFKGLFCSWEGTRKGGKGKEE